MQRDKQHASTTPSTVRCIFIEIVYLHLPQPTNTIHAATISTTAIDHSFFNKQCEIHNCNTQSVLFFLFNLLGSTTYQCMLHFPLPLCSFSTLPLTTRYTTASTFHVAFPTAIELLQLPLVDNYTPACTTLQNIFHHHQLLNLQVVLSSLLQPANTAPSTFRVAFPTAINQQAQLH